MKCMAVECSSDAVEGELFCHAHIRMTAEVDPMECPRGCGPMAYKQDRWNVGLWILGSFVAFLLLIEMFVLAVLVSISIMTWGGWQHKQNASYRFSCFRCEGVLLDHKTLSGIKNYSGISDLPGKLMSELDNSIESSEIKCPGCEVRMARIPISYVLPDQGTGITIIDLIQLAVPNTMNLMELDGCRDCGLIWFDKGEIDNIKKSQTLRGESFGEAGKKRYSEGYQSREAFKGIKIERAVEGRSVMAIDNKRKKTGSSLSRREFTYCSIEGCNSLAFRSLEYCHRHK